MIKIKYAFALLLTVMTITHSCKKDDSKIDPPPPPKDRGPEAARAQIEIEEFLATHFYNYEDFQNDPENFQIKFDTISGDNAGKTPLKDQVTFKLIKDIFDTSVEYKMYYLKVREGAGEKPHFSDFVTVTYDGRLMNLDLFDSSVVPVRLDLVDDRESGRGGVIRGLQQAIIEFGVAGSLITNPDGSITAVDYGIGTVFIPAGLGYYNYPPNNGGLKAYGQLIFSFGLYGSVIADHDGDGIPSYMEDLNGNQWLMDDDTDGNGIPNYEDADDDGDGRPTRNEIIINEDGTIEFPDTNGNGIPDYLDKTI